MENPKQKLLDRIRESTNVLVTVSTSPSVDQLAGAIGLTLLLNKLGKHGTAVFSGEVPDVLEFLQPAATLEKNTDSLRDFIIALDKSKADKLRYKVEDKMVKIFITPYHAALTEKDLEFSQGDFNVDVVIAIGVHEQRDLDQAITSHGRILHDATVSSINNQTQGNLGTINWVDATASSLCEMLYDLAFELKSDGLDAQMATALLTGIVSETRRFGNNKTTAKSMETSSHLISAGANQLLVAAKLEEKPLPIPEKPVAVKPVQPALEKLGATNTHKNPEAIPQAAGTLKVYHAEGQSDTEGFEQIHIDEHGVLRNTDEPVTEEVQSIVPVAQPTAVPITSMDTTAEDDSNDTDNSPRFILEPPTLGSKLTANDEAEKLDPSTDPLGQTSRTPLLSHDSGPAVPTEPMMPLPEPQIVAESTELSEQSTDSTIEDNKTLSQIEQDVASPHISTPVAQNNESSVATPDLNAARDAVVDAMSGGPDLSLPTPRTDLNANPMDLNIGRQSQTEASIPGTQPSLSEPVLSPAMPIDPSILDSMAVPNPSSPMVPSAMPTNLFPLEPNQPQDNTASTLVDPSAPPLVPPPMPPSFMPTSVDSSAKTPFTPL